LKLIHFLAQSYYCIVVMLASTVAALVVSIKYYGRQRNLRIFMYYIAFSLLEDVVGLCTLLAPDIRSVVLTGSIAINSFALIEFIIFHFFILHYITSPIRRWIIKINAFAFPALLTFILIKTYPVGLNTIYIVLECVFLLLPCLLYFYELFQKVNLQPLKDQPAFWIVTAFLFHSACTIPYGLTAGFLGKYQEAASSVIYILYSLVFLFIIRANLCPPENSAADDQFNKFGGPAYT